MFAPRRHHGPPEWAYSRGKVRAAARTILQILDEENARREWRDRGSQLGQQRGWEPKREPRRLANPPPRSRQGTRWPRQWRPPFGGDRRWGGSPEQFPPRATPRDWRSRVLPRRGPPVAAIRVPRWTRQEETCERQPRGVKPRGTLRGGPERSAEDPPRKPQGGLCGGPERSGLGQLAHDLLAQNVFFVPSSSFSAFSLN